MSVSISEMYSSIKKEKREGEKSQLAQTVSTLRADLDGMSVRMSAMNTDVKTLEDQLKKIDVQKISEYGEKHKTLKENYNVFVSSYNQSMGDLKVVIADLAKRLNDVESKL